MENMVCYHCGLSKIAHGGLCYGCSVHFHGTEGAAKLQKKHDEGKNAQNAKGVPSNWGANL
jgi:hypothetical protein